MKQIVFVVAMMVTMFAGIIAEAHPHGYKVKKRQHQQQARIQQGVRSGEINRHEAHHLRAQQMRIRHTKRVAAADGRVTPYERQRLHNMQNKANRNIYYAKHNNHYRR